MALKTVPELVMSRLPYLVVGDAEKVTDAITETLYETQQALNKTDEQVEAYETEYLPLERMLVADYTAYTMLKVKALATIGGTAGAAPATRVLKRAKADVVETEFESLKRSDGSTIHLDTETILSELKKSICTKARTLAVVLPICIDGEENTAIPFPFIVLN